MMKTGALGVILIILLAILFIGSIKATVTIAYSDEVKLFVRVLFIKIKILPSKKGKRVGGMSAAKAEKIRKSLNKKINKKNLSAEEKKKRKAQNAPSFPAPFAPSGWYSPRFSRALPQMFRLLPQSYCPAFFSYAPFSPAKSRRERTTNDRADCCSTR